MLLKSFRTAFFVSLISTSLAADTINYEAHWHPGQRTSLHTAPLELAAFEALIAELAQDGLALIDVETSLLNGQRVFAGLFSQSTARIEFTPPLGAVAFREERVRREGNGERLFDFEIFRLAEGGRRYIGLWQDGTSEQILTGPMEPAAFVARAESHFDNGLRLRDVEVEDLAQGLRYSGLFSAGAGVNSINGPMTRAALIDEIATRAAIGEELDDFERVGGGAANSFIAVWRSGSDIAALSQPMDIADQFILSQSQFNAGLRTFDFELQLIPGNVGSGAGISEDGTPILPPNPENVSFNAFGPLRLRFIPLDDDPFQLVLPLQNLPDWLPMDGDRPVLPDTHCGLWIRKADSISWQVGETVITDPPFNSVPNVFLGTQPPPAEGETVTPSDLFDNGVQFDGPMGGCTGTQEEWTFPEPFTTDPLFVPLPNLELVIGMRPETEIHFISKVGPSPKPIDVDKLYKDNSLKILKLALSFWKDLADNGGQVDEYCEGMQRFWRLYCTEFATEDEVCPAVVEEEPLSC